VSGGCVSNIPLASRNWQRWDRGIGPVNPIFHPLLHPLRNNIASPSTAPKYTLTSIRLNLCAKRDLNIFRFKLRFESRAPSHTQKAALVKTLDQSVQRWSASSTTNQDGGGFEEQLPVNFTAQSHPV